MPEEMVEWIVEEQAANKKPSDDQVNFWSPPTNTGQCVLSQRLVQNDGYSGISVRFGKPPKAPISQVDVDYGIPCGEWYHAHNMG